MLLHEHISSILGVCIMVTIYLIQRRRAGEAPAAAAPVKN
jgi:hypothetical protein